MLKSLYKASSNIMLMTGTIGLSTILMPTKHADAAGFYIQEQSVKGLGTAFAGSTTSLDDASTVYFNPAGMTKLDGPQINAGVHLLIPIADLDDTGSTDLGITGNPFQDNGNPYDPTPVPNLFAVTPLEFMDQQLWAGIGVTAPFGLGNDYDRDSFTRYDATKSELTTINISPSLAYQATEWLSIGGGIDIQYAKANLQSLVLTPGGEGVFKLKGDDWGFGYNVGLQVKPSKNTEIGLHYRSEVHQDLDGDVSLITGTPAGGFTADAKAKLNLPDIATLGIAHDLTPQTRLMGQATWFGWDNFDQIAPRDDAGVLGLQAVEQGYENSYAFAVGIEHELNDEWTVRAGYQYDQTPTTDEFRTTRTPDGDRHWITGGGTYKLNEKMDLDFAAAYIDIASEDVNVIRNDNPLGPTTTSARASGYVSIVSVGLNYKF